MAAAERLRGPAARAERRAGEAATRPLFCDGARCGWSCGGEDDGDCIAGEGRYPHRSRRRPPTSGADVDPFVLGWASSACPS
jgi:hypothetical protein